MWKRNNGVDYEDNNVILGLQNKENDRNVLIWKEKEMQQSKSKAVIK